MLTEQQKAFYKENGFIKLDNIFTPQEMDVISDEYDELFRMKQNQDIEATWKGSKMKEAAKNSAVSVLSLHNLQFHSAVFTSLLSHKKLMDAVEDIVGPNVLLHHTKAHMKPPEKGAPFVTHQDYHYFPYKKDSMVAVFIHLDDSTPENGGLCVYPGSHKLGPLPDKGEEEKGKVYHCVDQDEYPIAGGTPVIARRGEVLIFSYLLVHGSYLNTSTRVRRMYLMQLMSADDEPLEEVHKSPGQGLVLRGRNYQRDATLANRFIH